MKCHLEAQRTGTIRTGPLNVFVEGHDVTPPVIDARGVYTEEIKDAAREFLAKHGARYGVDWFEQPGDVRFRMVKHQMGDTYALVAVVPFQARRSS